MSEDEKYELIPMEDTLVLAVSPDESTLLIDTANELNKGYMWLNTLLGEVLNERYREIYVDDEGNKRARTKFHPMTMKLLEERRKTIDQMFRILGGEARNEIAKEAGKYAARAIFEASKNKETKQKYKKQAIQVIEAGLDEQD